MANGRLSRAQVGLALASALVVLLASGVAISRISERDGESPVATGPSSTSSSLPGLGQPGPAVGSGPSGAAGTGAPAEQAAPASGEAASAESPVTHGVTRTTRPATGKTGAGAPASSAAAATGASTGSGSGSGSPAGSGASTGEPPPSGASQGGGQESPPAPSQQPPEALATASVSAGEGAEGAVVGVGLNGGPDLDLTVGTNQVVGDHPPSEGTGVTFGGRFLQPPPSIPVPPG